MKKHAVSVTGALQMAISPNMDTQQPTPPSELQFSPFFEVRESRSHITYMTVVFGDIEVTSGIPREVRGGYDLLSRLDSAGED